MNCKELKEKILQAPLPKHIGIILDGNGRWAKKRLLPRIKGHEKGIKTLKEIVEETKNLGIPNLTVFAFSTENWKRPQDEVDYILSQIKKFYQTSLEKLIEKEIRVKFIGFKEGIPQDILMLMEEIEEKTKKFTDFIFTIAFNYGSRGEIVNTVKLIVKDVENKVLSINDINEETFEKRLMTSDLYPLDFIIRTSGEKRLSNFLLYQASYAELYFPDTLWPDFHKKELYLALYEYQHRNRRFGGLK